MEEKREGEARIVWKVSLPDTRQERRNVQPGERMGGWGGRKVEEEGRMEVELEDTCLEPCFSGEGLTGEACSSSEVDGRVVES